MCVALYHETRSAHFAAAIHTLQRVQSDGNERARAFPQPRRYQILTRCSSSSQRASDSATSKAA
jgi:hypothetical protein